MKLLFISSLALLMVSTSALAIYEKDRKTESTQSSLVIQQVRSNKYPENSFPKLPTLSSASSFPVISARTAMATDLDSGVALYEKDPDKPSLPASTTKIVTSLVAMDYYPKEEVLKVGITNAIGQRMGLSLGEEITVDSLLKGLLIASANDAAEVLAQNYPGGRNSFISAMNMKAREINLGNTFFANPSGIDAPGHISTARDLIRAADYAMENPYFSELVGTVETVVGSTNGSITHKLVNINELVGKVDGVLGVKTGWTEGARENLVTYIERDGHRVMIAVLGSQDRFGETEELIEWIFGNYTWEEVTYPLNPKYFILTFGL